MKEKGKEGREHEEEGWRFSHRKFEIFKISVQYIQDSRSNNEKGKGNRKKVCVEGDLKSVVFGGIPNKGREVKRMWGGRFQGGGGGRGFLNFFAFLDENRFR